jgi:ParB family chromosome partitioning protein
MSNERTSKGGGPGPMPPTGPLAAGKRPALGRGLSALLPGAGAPVGQPRGFMTVPIDEVASDVAQPRRYWNLKALEELTASVRTKGIIQPILVRRLPEGGYRIIAGERRYRAGREAGLEEVPVIVKEVSDGDAFELALIENIQREDLNPIEEAEAYQRLLTEHGLTQETVAARVGKERSTITNALRLLKLPGEVREHVAAGTLSAGHAKVLLGLDDEETIQLVAGQVAQKGLSVRDTERLVQRRKNPDPEKPEPPAPPARLASLAKKLEKGLRSPVELRLRAGEAGEVALRFGSEEQGAALLESLVAAIAAMKA